MRFWRELAEPWGLLLAASSAGAAWAVQLPVVAAAGIGGAVLLARAGFAAWQGRGASSDRIPLVDPDSVEGRWLERAESAESSFEDLIRSLPAGPLADQVVGMRAGLEDTLDTLHTLAGRTSTTNQAMSRIDPAALAEEERRLRHARRTAGSDLHGDLDRSLASVAEQRDVHQRLSAARDKLLAQLESGALGLEGLVARLVELTATTGPGPDLETGTLAELTDRLEGLRRGVVETDEATRRSLGGG